MKKETDSPLRRPKLSGSRVIVCQYFRQLSSLLNGQVTLLESLQNLSLQTDYPAFQPVAQDVSRTVEAGNPFSEALQRYPTIFSADIVAMVRAGESNGQLTALLVQASQSLEKRLSLILRIQAALFYPALVLSVTLLLSLVITTTVLPNFVEIFRSSSMPLPWATVVLMHVTDAVGSFWFWLAVLGLGLIAYPFARHWLTSQRGQIAVETVIWKTPGLGPLAKYSALSTYCLVLENLITSGVYLPESVEIAAAASGSGLLIADAPKLKLAIEDGQSPSEHYLRAPHLYPPSLGHMVRAAEESSHLAIAFSSVAQWFSQELDFRIELLRAMIEPVLMAVVGSMVAFVVLAIFLPLYSNLSALGG